MNKNLVSLQALFVAVGAIHIAAAALGTLVALDIAAFGGSQEDASAVASSYSLGFLVGCFWIARPLARIGHVRAFSAAAALCTLTTLVLAETENIPVTMLSRFLTGLATAGLYAIADAWINDSAEAASRGRILSVYSIVLGVCSVASQIFVIVYSDRVSSAFPAISALFCIAIMVIATTRTDPKPSENRASVRILATYALSPTAFVGAFLNGLIVTIVLFVLPFQVSVMGVTPTVIAIGIAATYAGRIFLQYPLGSASDRMDRRIVIAGASLILATTLAATAILSGLEGSILLREMGAFVEIFALGLGMLLGGTLLPLYSLLTAHAMDRTVPVYIGSTAVTLLFVYSVGGVVGPLASSAITMAFGGSALLWFLAALMALFAAYTLVRMRTRDAAPQAEHARHQPGAITSVEMAPDQKR